VCNKTITLGGKEAIDGTRFTKLAEALDEYTETAVIAAAAKKAADQAKAKVDNWMRDHGHTRVAIGKVRIDRIPVLTARFDTTKFKSAHPKLAEEFTFESASTRLSFFTEK
jgi:hypothetical protein